MFVPAPFKQLEWPLPIFVPLTTWLLNSSRKVRTSSKWESPSRIIPLYSKLCNSPLRQAWDSCTTMRSDKLSTLSAWAFSNTCSMSGTPTQICRVMSWRRRGSNWFKARGKLLKDLGMKLLETYSFRTSLRLHHRFFRCSHLELMLIIDKQKATRTTPLKLPALSLQLSIISRILASSHQSWRTLEPTTFLEVLLKSITQW